MLHCSRTATIPVCRTGTEWHFIRSGSPLYRSVFRGRDRLLWNILLLRKFRMLIKIHAHPDKMIDQCQIPESAIFTRPSASRLNLPNEDLVTRGEFRAGRHENSSYHFWHNGGTVPTTIIPCLTALDARTIVEWAPNLVCSSQASNQLSESTELADEKSVRSLIVQKTQ